MSKTIFIIGPETPLDLLILWDLLKRQPQINITLLVQSHRMSRLSMLRTILSFIRRKGIRFTVFNILLNVQLSRKLFFHKDIRPPTLQKILREKQIDCYRFFDINRDGLIQIQALQPTLIINHMSQLFRAPLFSLPNCEVVNVHPGLLPQYQGMGSCLWPFIEGSPYHGATLHRINSEEFDTGPLLYVGRYTISHKESVLSLHIKSRRIGAMLLQKLIDDRIAGLPVEDAVQNRRHYRKLPSRSELSQMCRDGHSYFRLSDLLRPTHFSQESIEVCYGKTNWCWQTLEDCVIAPPQG
jgi:formyltetrahydrofolate hydrolase